MKIRVPAQATPEQLEAAYAQGLLRKETLEDGAYYEGFCRNASVARWNARLQCFLYIRTKFNERFVEEIRHPADERHYDVFAVTAKVDDPPEAARVREETFEAWGKPREPDGDE